MTVISGDPFRERPMAPGRLEREGGDARAAAAPPRAAPPEAKAGSPQVQPAITLQHSLSRAQTVLAGLEGFRDLLRPGARCGPEDVRRYLKQVRYNNREVLDTYAERLVRIAGGGDASALEALIATVRSHIQELSTGLLRHETTQGRGANGQEDPLREVIRGIKEANSLIRLKRENVLDLMS